MPMYLVAGDGLLDSSNSVILSVGGVGGALDVVDSSVGGPQTSYSASVSGPSGPKYVIWSVGGREFATANAHGPIGSVGRWTVQKCVFWISYDGDKSLPTVHVFQCGICNQPFLIGPSF